MLLATDGSSTIKSVTCQRVFYALHIADLYNCKHYLCFLCCFMWYEALKQAWCFSLWVSDLNIVRFPDFCAFDLNTSAVQFSSMHASTQLMFSEVVYVGFLEMITSQVLSPAWNCWRLMDVEWWCGGSEFQTSRVATGKLCRPRLIVVICGTNRSPGRTSDRNGQRYQRGRHCWSRMYWTTGAFEQLSFAVVIGYLTSKYLACCTRSSTRILCTF